MSARLRILAVDLVLLLGATVLALALRENLTLDAGKLSQLTPYMLFSLAAAVPLFKLLGLDRAFWTYTALPDYVRSAAAVCLTALSATVAALLFNGMHGVSPSIPILQAALAILALVGFRGLVRTWSRGEGDAHPASALAPVERNMRAESVLVIGVNRLAMLLLQQINGIGSPVRAAGVMALDQEGSGRSLLGYPVFAPEEDFSDILRKLSLHGVTVHRILVAVAPEELPSKLRTSLQSTAQARGIRLDYAREALEALYPADVSRPAPFAPCEELQRLSFNPELIAEIVRRPYWRFKRALDMLMAGMLLVALAPLLVALGAFVRVMLGSPVWFWQVRTGYRGRPFRLYKFRSMIEAYGSDGKPADDKLRETMAGRLLRASRLDELPQLWNILIGEMSFIGPRPLLPVDQLSGASVRCLARPGLTGWAQVMGGRNVEAADKMALDMWYVQNASLRLDIEIVVRTLMMLVSGERVRRDVIRSAWEDLRRASTSRSLEPATALVDYSRLPFELWDDRTRSWHRGDLGQEASRQGS